MLCCSTLGGGDARGWRRGKKFPLFSPSRIYSSNSQCRCFHCCLNNISDFPKHGRRSSFVEWDFLVDRWSERRGLEEEWKKLEITPWKAKIKKRVGEMPTLWIKSWRGEKEEKKGKTWKASRKMEARAMEEEKKGKMLCKNLCLDITNEYFVEKSESSSKCSFESFIECGGVSGSFYLNRNRRVNEERHN